MCDSRKSFLIPQKFGRRGSEDSENVIKVRDSEVLFYGLHKIDENKMVLVLS